MEREIPDHPAHTGDGSLGLMMHWGPYSVPAYDDPALARRRHTMNGSEWYAHRLYTRYRVSRGDEATKAHHASTYGSAEEHPYHAFVADLTGTHWDPRALVSLCREVGASYLVITARHHDGYCMWDARETSPSWNSVETGPRRDVLAEVELECRRSVPPILFGVYYSLLEWEWAGKPGSTTRAKGLVTPMSKARVRKVHTQVRELLSRYRPDVWWFDGDWVGSWDVPTLLREIWSVTPHARVNDRLGRGVDLTHLRERARESGGEVCSSTPDRWIPEHEPECAWESVHTIGLSWGRNEMQAQRDYKSGGDLRTLYTRVRGVVGRLLLNVGPNRHGVLDPREVSSLQEMARTRQ